MLSIRIHGLILVTILTAYLGAGAQEAAPPAPDIAGKSKAELRFAGRTFDEWKESLESDLDVGYRMQAIRAIAALGKHGDAAEALAILVPWTQSEHPEFARQAILGLCTVGAPAASALRTLLDDEEYVQRQYLLDAIGSLGPESAAIVPALDELVRSPKREERNAALLAIVRIGAPEETALEVLRRTVELIPRETDRNPQGDPMNRPFSMGLQDSVAKSGLPRSKIDRVMLELQSHEDPLVSEFATSMLAHYGEHTPEVETALEAFVSRQLDGKLPAQFRPAVAMGANGGLMLRVQLRALQKLDLADSQVREAMLIRNVLAGLNFNLGPTQRLSLDATFRMAAKSALPLVLKILEHRRRPTLGPMDQECLKYLELQARDSQAAVPILQQMRDDAQKQATPENIRFWTTLIDNTLSAIVLAGERQ